MSRKCNIPSNFLFQSKIFFLLGGGRCAIVDGSTRSTLRTLEVKSVTEQFLTYILSQACKPNLVKLLPPVILKPIDENSSQTGTFKEIRLDRADTEQDISFALRSVLLSKVLRTSGNY